MCRLCDGERVCPALVASAVEDELLGDPDVPDVQVWVLEGYLAPTLGIAVVLIGLRSPLLVQGL